MVVVAGGVRRERVSVSDPPRHVVPYPLSQPVVVVPRVVDREESPVLGVQHKEQAIQKNQGSLPDVRETLVRGVRHCPDEAGEDTLEDNARKVLCNLLLVAASLNQRRFQEAGRGAALRNKGSSTEQNMEDTQIVFAGRPDQFA